MLDKLKKFLSAPADNPAKAETQKEDIAMTDEEKQAQLAAENKTAEMAASLEAASKALAEKEQAFAEMATKLEAATAALSALEAEKAQLKAEANAKVQAERKDKLAQAVGEDKATEMVASFESLSETQFDAVVGAMAKSFEVEASGKMFKEQGADVEADTTTLLDPVKRLGAMIAAATKTN